MMKYIHLNKLILKKKQKSIDFYLDFFKSIPPT